MIMSDILSDTGCYCMATPSLTASTHTSSVDTRPRLDKKPGLLTVIIFFAVLAMGLLFTAYSLMRDMHELGTLVTTWTPFLLLGVAGFLFFRKRAKSLAAVIIAMTLGVFVIITEMIYTEAGTRIGDLIMGLLD